MKVAGPGLGVITFADEDLSPGDASWYCVRGELAIDTGHALRTIEEELYKVAARVTGVFPSLPKP